MKKQKKIDRWTENESEALLECIDRYSGTVDLLIKEAAKSTGRTKSSVRRRLLKMGVLVPGRGGGLSTYRRKAWLD